MRLIGKTLRLVVTALAGFALACAKPDAPAPSSSAPPHASAATSALPEHRSREQLAAFEPQIAAILRATLAEAPHRAAALALIDGDASWTVGFGRRGFGSADPPNAETAFEIGSVSKLLAGVLLAEAVVRGEVALTDPLTRYLPDSMRLAERGGALTLLHLATHSSGFPLMPDNWLPRDPKTHRVRYRIGDFEQFLREFERPFTAGERYRYSNVDTTLLAMALSARAKLDYGALLEERIFRPLGMKRSAFVDRERKLVNVLEGYDDHDVARVPRIDVSPIAPCCAVRSTLSDMIRFAQAALGQASPLERAFRLAVEPRVPIGSDRTRFVGLGWESSQREGTLAKAGQVEGHRCVLLLYSAKRQGLFLVVNSERADISGLGAAIADAVFQPRPVGPGRVAAAHRSQLVSALPPDAQPASVRFSDSVELAAWTAPRYVRRGERAKIAFYYRCLKPLGADYRVFVHGDAESKRVERLHGDHYPGNGKGSTLEWRAGELIRDEFELEVPKDYAAKRFTVWTGFYRGEKRLPAKSATGRVDNNRAAGPEIQVGEYSAR